MNVDDRIVEYMKERNQYAGTVACTVAVQLFALAVYFCIYALIAGGVFYSLSENAGKIIAICVCAAIATILAVINILCVIKGNRVYITRPDRIALKDSYEVVRLAYTTARPVLIFKITCSLVLVSVSALVYIILTGWMSDQALASIYIRIVICLILAFAFLFAYPCIDRIACYRALLNETHELYYDTGRKPAVLFVIGIAIPAAVCVWYLLRYYSNKQDIAWIVYPLTAVFVMAFVFLFGWTASLDKGDGV